MYQLKHLKVLMATMGLDLGGAETHIVELAKELRREGYDISAVSNGGVYVEELAEYGIPHYYAPLNQRSFSAILKSLITLNRILRTEHPDVVHAHARIPAFLCSLVCKWHRIPMVTTAHFNFKTSGGLKAMTRWGSRSIAVSEDLKRYLIENYGMPGENISVTINGISTEKFSPDTPTDELRAKLAIPEDKKVILTVSRMDHNACAAAFKLIASAERIYQEHPDTRIVVVGSGDALEEIRSNAAAVNEKLGFPYIICTGGRTDINRFCALCDIFVGVSRAALEAMACGKPAILAGNQGFLGTYMPRKLSDCIKTNFTCRDIPYPEGDPIGDEVCRLLSLKEIDRAEIGNISRQLIFDSYSVNRMAADATAVYQAVQYEGRKKFDYVICGYYGYQNTGDDAMLQAILRNLRAENPDIRISILTRHPYECKISGVTPIGRFNYFSIKNVIHRSRAMIFGGGNLIQDATSKKSLHYYLWLLRCAQRFGLKTMLYANGVGPISSPSCQKRAAYVLDKMDVITLREAASADLLDELGVKNPYIEVTADEVLTLFENNIVPSEGKDYIAVSLRNWPKNDPAFVQKMAAALDEIATSSGKRICFVPLQPSIDTPFCQKISKFMRKPNEVFRPTSVEEVQQLIAESSLLIGMRLHSLVFAAGAAVPSIGIVYDPKIEGFLEQLGTHRYFPCENFSASDIVISVLSALQEEEYLRPILMAKAQMLRTAAARNAVLAANLFDENKEVFS